MYEAELSDLPIADLHLRYWTDSDDPLEVVETVSEADSLGGTDPATVLVDDRMWATFTQDLRELLPDAEFGLASTVLEPLRIRKDEVELAALRRAGELADRVSLEIRERGDELLGMTEAELAAEIDRLLAADGGEEPAFETIVASGPNGGSPAPPRRLARDRIGRSRRPRFRCIRRGRSRGGNRSVSGRSDPNDRRRRTARGVRARP